MKALAVLAALFLAACPLQTSHTATLGGGAAPPSTTTDPPRPGEGDPQKENAAFAETFFGREKFAKLRGLTVEQAKANAKKLGHTGEIKVDELDEFVQGCAAGTVCSATDELGGQSGMQFKDTLLLNTNKALSIAPPPD